MQGLHVLPPPSMVHVPYSLRYPKLFEQLSSAAGIGEKEGGGGGGGVSDDKPVAHPVTEVRQREERGYIM